MATATDPPANLAYVEGGVDLVHEGLSERADPPMIVDAGDVVHTRNGRAEVVFADGTLLHVDQDSEIEFLGPEHFRLLSGRVLLRLSAAAAQPYIVDTPAASVRLDASGEYQIASSDARALLEVAVVRGHAEIDDGSRTAAVRSGEMISLPHAGGRPLFQPFNSARFDAFARWSIDRARGFATAHSAAQLPYELRPYGPLLDQHGRWDYVAPHGYVWFPSVGVAWRPYYEGAWSYRRHGWTWHGRDRWAWPTHHFGRWGFTGSFWYWVPTRVWGPAWVSWGFAPGYVSWSPLGWDGRPVIAFASGYSGYGPYSPWRAWTVVRREHFGFRRPVRLHALDGSRLGDSVRRSWVVQNAPPITPPTQAVARDNVAVPAARGAARRGIVDVPRRGNVRDPQAAQRSAPASRRVDRGQRSTPDEAPGVVTTDRAGVRGRQRDPRYAVPRSAPPPVVSTPPPADSAEAGAVSRERRPRTTGGATREPAPAPVSRPRGTRSSPPPAEPRTSQPRAAAPRAPQPARSEPSSEAGGARQRGGAAVAAPARSAPAPSGRPSGGAVRRRPGG